jgi:hypothetical protein
MWPSSPPRLRPLDQKTKSGPYGRASGFTRETFTDAILYFWALWTGPNQRANLDHDLAWIGEQQILYFCQQTRKNVIRTIQVGRKISN